MKVGDVVKVNKKYVFPYGITPPTTGVVVFVNPYVEDYYLVNFDGWEHGHDGRDWSGVPTFKCNSCWWLCGSSLELVDEFNSNV